MRVRAVGSVLAVLGVFAPEHCLGELSAQLPFGGSVYVTGEVSTQLGFGLHRDSEADAAPGVKQQGDRRGLHYTYTWLDLETDWRFGEHWLLRVNPYVIADLNYVFFDGTEDWRIFEPSRRNLEVDDAPQRIFHEAYLDYSRALFQVRFGQQRVGWGEADGLRLADVVSPLDITRQAFLFGEGFERSRIPETMLRLIVTPGPLILGGRRIFRDWALEGIVAPQIEPTRAYISPNGRYGGTGAGGVWALPPVDWKDRTEVLNLPAPLGTFDGFLPDDQIRAHDRQPHWQWENPLLAARITGNLAKSRVTFNFVQRVGGFLDAAIVGIRNIKVTKLPDRPRTPGFAHPVSLAALDINLTYPRRNIVGFTFNHDLADVLRAPGFLGATSPVLRVEAIYNIGHPFNTAQRVKQRIPRADIQKFPNVTSIAFPRFKQRKDFVQYMIGFDWPLRVAWLNPVSEVFSSLQFFHFALVNPKDKLALQPYKRLLIREHQFFLTFLAFTPYWNRRIIPEVLSGLDVNMQSYFVKARISHEIGDHWRIEEGIVYFNRGRGAPTESLFGLWDRRTDLFVRVAYQF